MEKARVKRVNVFETLRVRPTPRALRSKGLRVALRQTRRTLKLVDKPQWLSITLSEILGTLSIFAWQFRSTADLLKTL